jgi:hypothetical protein
LKLLLVAGAWIGLYHAALAILSSTEFGKDSKAALSLFFAIFALVTVLVGAKVAARNSASGLSKFAQICGGVIVQWVVVRPLYWAVNAEYKESKKKDHD